MLAAVTAIVLGGVVAKKGLMIPAQRSLTSTQKSGIQAQG
jgi:hypothetical protein